MKRGRPPSDRTPGETRLQQLAPLILLIVAAAPPLARFSGIVTWPWAVVFAPLTLFGLWGLGGAVAMIYRDPVGSFVRRLLGHDEDPGSTTPVPDVLEPVSQAEGTREQILARHPELLAGLCLGMAHKKVVSRVLGRRVTDPWGVYQAVLDASPGDLEKLRTAAFHHTVRLQKEVQQLKGRMPSESALVKQSVRAFHQFAARGEAGQDGPEGAYELLAAVYGTSVPSRDRHLKSIAPRVRRLLEIQYPQLATARLADGSSVKFAEWQEQAARERRELKDLRKEHQRLEERLEEAHTEVAELRRELRAVRESLDEEKASAHREARAEREEAFEELRAVMAEQSAGYARGIHRMEVENARLLSALDDLTAERDQLEAALFPPDEDEGAPVDTARLNGLRVLLVGGREGQVPPLREAVEEHGAQLVHMDHHSAVDLVAGVHLVVIWIRFVSHSVSNPVRRECRVREVPVLYWSMTSAPSLVRLIAAGPGGAPAGPGSGPDRASDEGEVAAGRVTNEVVDGG